MALFGGIIGMVLGVVLLIAAILIIVAPLGIWTSISKIEKYTKELLQLKRLESGLDPITGKVPTKTPPLPFKSR